MRWSILAFTVTGAFVLPACAQIAGVGDRARLSDDAGADAAGADAAGADAASDASSEPNDEPVVEVCNFKSENYEGLTDHGFDWTLGTWQSGPAVTNAGDVKAVALAGGRVAVAVLDQDAARAQVFVVDSTGALVAGPTDITACAPFSGFGIAAAGFDAGEIGVAVGSSDPQCSPNCVSLTRYDAGSLSVLETRALDPSAAGQTYKVQDIYDLGWSTAGYVALVLDGDGEPRIIMADHMGDKFGSPQWTGVFSVGGPDVGALAIGPEIGWAMSGSLGGMPQAAIGITSMGAYYQTLPPQSPDVPSRNPRIARDGKAVAWLGRDLVYTRSYNAYAVQEGELSRIDATGKVVATTIAGSGLGTAAHSVVVVDGSPVVTYFEPGGIGIARFSPDVTRVDTPSGDIHIADTNLHSIVAYSGGVTLVRVSPDGSHIEAAPLQCP